MEFYARRTADRNSGMPCPGIAKEPATYFLLHIAGSSKHTTRLVCDSLNW